VPGARRHPPACGDNHVTKFNNIPQHLDATAPDLCDDGSYRLHTLDLVDSEARESMHTPCQSARLEATTSLGGLPADMSPLLRGARQPRMGPPQGRLERTVEPATCMGTLVGDNAALCWRTDARGRMHLMGLLERGVMAAQTSYAASMMPTRCTVWHPNIGSDLRPGDADRSVARHLPVICSAGKLFHLRQPVSSCVYAVLSFDVSCIVDALVTSRATA